jgi:hypothetical protein
MLVVMHIKLFAKEMSISFPGSGDTGAGDDFEKGYPFGWRNGCCVDTQGAKILLENRLVD